MKIQIGSFNCIADGWINTDVTPHIWLAKLPRAAWLLWKLGRMSDDRYSEHQRGTFKKLMYMNAAAKWPFKNACADAVFSSHVLEHLPLEGAKVCVSEAHRVLKPGGVLRIVVPDLDVEIRNFSSMNAMNWAITFFEATQTSEKNMHHFMYNYISLSEILIEAGFSKIRQTRFRDGKCPDLLSLDNRPESLFVEATKQ